MIILSLISLITHEHVLKMRTDKLKRVKKYLDFYNCLNSSRVLLSTAVRELFV